MTALVRWGKFQSLQEGDDLGESLRTMILPGLKLIRFHSLTQQEIIHLCQKELGEVLSGDEKWSMLMSITSGDWKLMPNDVVSLTKPTARCRPYTFVSLPYAVSADKIDQHFFRHSSESLSFKINRNATIIGIKLNLAALVHDQITFALVSLDRLNTGEATKAIGSTKETALHGGEVFCKFNTMVKLAANTPYQLEFSLKNCDCDSEIPVYKLPRANISSISDGLTLIVASLNLSIHVQGLLFALEKSL